MNTQIYSKRDQIIGILLTIFMIFAVGAKAAENGKIVFTSNGEISTINSDGSGRRQLTNFGSADFPKFSPNGRKIAFYQFGAIYLMDADGGNQIPLVPTGSFGRLEFRITWSPDSSRLAFTCGGICIVNADGSNRIQISSDSRDSAPDWSPDGSRIAFTRRLSFYNYEIYVMDINGNTQTRLTTNDIGDYEPVWSPDGSKIAFLKDSACIFLSNGETICFGAEIITMNADGSNHTSIVGGSAFDDDYVLSPGWSPDGTKIVFSGEDPANLTYEIFVINVNGSNRISLTNTANISELSPDWGNAAPVPFAAVSGRILTPDGRSLRNAVVVLTDSLGIRRTATTSSFGSFTFDTVATGETYVIGVSSKRYRFTSRNLIVTGSLTDVDFVGLE